MAQAPGQQDHQNQNIRAMSPKDDIFSQNLKVLVIGATNRPFDIDEAALARLKKCIYIELPDG